jgi:hypothetical protein
LNVQSNIIASQRKGKGTNDVTLKYPSTNVLEIQNVSVIYYVESYNEQVNFYLIPTRS